MFYGLTHEHAAGKLQTLRALPDDFEIAAVVDDRATTSLSFQCEPARIDGLKLVSPGEAFSVPDVDLVFIEVTNADILPIAAECAARGLPMHCDKPCGEALEPYRTILEDCRKADLPFQIGYMYRGNPALKWLWKFARDGGLGDIRFVEADMNHDYQAEGYASYISSFRGGILYNLGCHLVDMVRPFVRGDYLGTTTFVKPAPGDPDGARTDGKALVRFSGTDVLVRTSSGMNGGVLSRRLRVDGTKGSVDLCPIERFDGKNLVLRLVVGNEERTMDFGVQTDRYADQLLDLAAIVRGDKPNDQDYEGDLLTHELTLKACGL